MPLFGSVTVSCTLTNGGTPVSGGSITFSYEGMLGPESITANTNSNGVATHTFSDELGGLPPYTITATYQGASATCTIEESL